MGDNLINNAGKVHVTCVWPLFFYCLVYRSAVRIFSNFKKKKKKKETTLTSYQFSFLYSNICIRYNTTCIETKELDIMFFFSACEGRGA